MITIISGLLVLALAVTASCLSISLAMLVWLDLKEYKKEGKQ